MNVDVNTILEDLKSDKSQRTRDSLDKLNALLEAQFNAGKKDYSIATIGRISEANGGVGTVSIRNKTGKHFRLLIDSWATKANTTMKKPLAPQSKQRGIPRDMDLLQRLDDPALRAVFGQIIAERNKLKRENHILKNNAEINIDIRPNQVIHAEQVHQAVAVLPALNGLLLPSEIEALEDAINEQKIIQRGWTVSKYGAVKDEHERPLFKNGFVIAIKKVLDQV
ncbi:MULTISPECIES: gamma-mobile-trio protein GmtX [Acinetobacter]|uniref:gamma-mobile-trio protein GmtX n=1 Tax=Acinetobacter TaxID=469 RepID=UPI0015D3A43B|nr:MULTISPECIES: gamma-mobile-trio protein GmtX [Acinetobacter]MCO8055508.1 gamma-mobile-trio protein GmtX [Acinetobacter towneri]